VSWLYIALLAAALAVVVAAEWPRLEQRVGTQVSAEARRRRQRERRKASLRVVQNPDQDDFAASVERDLANLPTTSEETDRRY
jgi:energy-coupling factor transporter ATP-binding protein EcfA2